MLNRPRITWRLIRSLRWKWKTMNTGSIAATKYQLKTTSLYIRGLVSKEIEMLRRWERRNLDFITPNIILTPYCGSSCSQPPHSQFPLNESCYYESRGGTSDFRLPTSDFWLLTSDLRLPTSDFRLPTSDFRLPTSDLRLFYFFYFLFIIIALFYHHCTTMIRYKICPLTVLF